MRWVALFFVLVGQLAAQITVSGAGVSGGIAQQTPATSPLTITTQGLPPGVQTVAYSQALAATGGQLPYTWALNVPTHSVIVTWTASQAANVTSYRLKRGTVSGGPYTQIFAANQLTATDNNVTNGNTYYYIVTTFAGGVESAPSAEAQAIIPTTPQPPPGIAITTAGVVSGTPTTTGNFTFSAQVTDNLATVAVKSLSIAITANTSLADNRYCTTGETWIGATTDGVASLPTACVYTAVAGTPSPGATKTVCPALYGSCDFTTVQAAISAATCGQTISIKATQDGTAATPQIIYDEAVTIPNKLCNIAQWITVQSSLTGSLPPEGNRIYPCWAGKGNPLFGRPGPAYACPSPAGIYMPKVRVISSCVPPSQTNPSGCSKSATSPVLTTGTSSYWRFIGIEFEQRAVVPQIGSTVVDAGTGDHIIFDRVVVHGGSDPNGQSIENYCKGVNLEGKNLALIDSYVYDIHSVWPAGVPNHIGCSDAQAVYLGGTNDDATFGTIKVVNNFLESSSEPFFSGGNAATVVPNNFEIRRNHTFHPLFWRTNCTPATNGCGGYTWFGTTFGVKNLGEFKNGNKVLIEGNIFSNNWHGDSDQNGESLLITPKNQNSLCPICQVSNVTVRYNLTEHTLSGIVIAAAPASQTGAAPAGLFNISVHDNILDDVGGPRYDLKWTTGTALNAGKAFSVSSIIPNTHDIVISHNTILNIIENSVTLSAGTSANSLQNNSTTSASGIFNITYSNNISSGGSRGSNPGITGLTPMCVNSNGPTANTLNGCWTNKWCFDGNVLPTAAYTAERPAQPYPGSTVYNAADPTSGSPNCGAITLKGNAAPTDFPSIGFVNLNGGSGGDYRLCTGVGAPAASCSAASIYVNSANDGRAPGADVPTVNSNIAGVQ